MSRSIYILILICFSQLYSYTQNSFGYSQHAYAYTRNQILKYGIEKVIITRKDKIGFTITTLVFDKKGNVTIQKHLSDYYKEFKPESGPSKYQETFSSYFDDTLWTRSIFKADDYETPGKYIIDTSFIQRKFNSNGRVYLEIEISSASPDRKHITHYNRYGLKDTLRILTTFKDWLYEKRLAFDSFYIEHEFIYTYDSLNRLETEYENLYGNRSRYLSPLIHKYTYHNDTVIQKDYRLKNGVLIPENSYRKTYANEKYRYEETHYDITEIFITNNSFGLPLREKQKYRNDEAIILTETTYEYFFRNPAMKKN